MSHIKIFGVIGTYIDENKIEIKGIELVDVIAQVEALGDVPEYTFEINSIGGRLDVGYAIGEYMDTLKAAGKIVNTIGNGIVASIATIPFLKGVKRQLVKGTKLLIHNPYVTNAEGDAEALSQYSKALAKEEKALAQHYSKSTGISETTMDLLMKENKPMEEDRAVQLKFATEVIDGTLNSEFTNMQVIACIKTTPIMDPLKESKGILSAIKAMIAKAKGEVKGLSVTTDDGKALEIEGETLAVGSLVTIDGEPTPSATYKLVNGTSFTTDAEGKISAITEPEAVEAKFGDIVKDDKGEIVKEGEAVMANGVKVKTNDKGEIVAMEAGEPVADTALVKENAKLKKDIEEMQETQTEIKAQMAILAKGMKSDYKPDARNTVFAKTETPGKNEQSSEGGASDVKERRKERAEAQKK